MPHLSPISPKKLIKILEQEGFECLRINGSHHYFLRKSDQRTTVVPVHGSKDIRTTLLRKILNDLDWSVEKFGNLRNSN